MFLASRSFSFTGRILVLALLLAIGFVFGSCKKESQHEELVKKIKEQDESTIQDYLTKNNLSDVATRTGSGLYYIIETTASGQQAANGKTVEVDYIGRFLNGTIFDSSYANARPLVFTLGRGEVITGWDEGVALMKEGEKFKLIVPSHLAYGLAGSQNIPPNTVLIFDTVLREVK
jgi:FKBP-type peptidyl-prolyl cis-trans isomerase